MGRPLVLGGIGFGFMTFLRFLWFRDFINDLKLVDGDFSLVVDGF